MEDEKVMALALEMAEHLVFGRVDPASDALDGIGHNASPEQMYRMLRWIAASGAKAVRYVNGPVPAGAFVGVVEVTPGALAGDPAQAFAARFMAASMNSDDATCEALFVAAFKAGSHEYSASVAALVSIAADAMRDAVIKEGRS